MENFSGKIFNAYLSRCNILLLFWNVNFVNIYIYIIWKACYLTVKLSVICFNIIERECLQF